MNLWPTCDFLELITRFSSPLFLSVNILGGCSGSLITPWRYGGSRCTTPLILNLGATWRWLSSVKPWSLYLRENKPITHSIGGGVITWDDLDALIKRKISCYWDLNLVTRLCLLKILKILCLRNKRRQTYVLFIICLKTMLIIQIRTVVTLSWGIPVVLVLIKVRSRAVKHN
jgi:hypothetical protein